MKVKAEEPRFTEMTAVNKAIEALAAPFILEVNPSKFPFVSMPSGAIPK